MSKKAMVLAVDLGEYDVDNSIDELTQLCAATDVEVVFSMVQKKEHPDSKYYIGEGKLSEAKDMAKNNAIDMCVFDCELTGSQIKSISDYLDMEVIDRTMLILEIFASRATTSEGKLQTELAMLKYRLPRLSGMGTSLSRQGGGGGGGGGARRGAGETKLEYDRRYINERISIIKQRLEKVSDRRDVLNVSRKKNDVPIIALTGYTNVGKSSLLNALTGSEILEKDMLFATLDPTARKLLLPSGQNAILVDTVGFVSRLPHNLVEAFKSTLEQAKYADIILNVCDASSADRNIQLAVTKDALSDIGCNLENVITVYNKCDKLDFIPNIDGVIFTSTKTGYGLDTLLSEIDKMLSARLAAIEVLLPYEKASIVNLIRENGSVISEEYTEKDISVKGFIDKKLLHMLKNYIIY